MGTGLAVHQHQADQIAHGRRQLPHLSSPNAQEPHPRAAIPQPLQDQILGAMGNALLQGVQALALQPVQLPRACGKNRSRPATAGHPGSYPPGRCPDTGADSLPTNGLPDGRLQLLGSAGKSISRISSPANQPSSVWAITRKMARMLAESFKAAMTDLISSRAS